MADHDEKSSRSSQLRERVRNTLGEVRRQSADSLRGVRRSVASAKDRLKSTEAAEQLGAAVELRRLIKKATDAQRRGNYAMAYRLLEPAVGEKPEEPKLVVAFWSAALACERAEDAAPALAGIIRKLAGSGKPERAAQLWMELREALPSSVVDPNALVRMVPALLGEGLPDQAVEALQETVDPRNTDLSPGLAVRIAEMAHDLDPPTALKAARCALATPDLHEARRERLENLVTELENAGAQAASDAPASSPARAAVAAAVKAAPDAPSSATPETIAPAAVGPAPDAPGATGAEMAAAIADEAPPDPPAATGAEMAAAIAVEAALEAEVPAARFGDIKLTEGMPTGFLDDGIALQLPGGRKARLDYAKIEAVAVAEVGGLAQGPVVVVDAVFNWSQPGDRTLNVVRFRSDGFDPRMVMATPTDAAEALCSFLSELLERTSAIPLPDPDSALGVNVRAFDSVEAYQREVLHVES
jgi:hypothetical protein